MKIGAIHTGGTPNNEQLTDDTKNFGVWSAVSSPPFSCALSKDTDR